MKLLLLITTFLSFSVYAGEFKKFDTDKIKFSETTIPFLINHPNLNAMNSYNNELKQIIDGLKCRAPKKLEDKTYWEIYTGIGYVNEDIISVKIRSNYNCDNLRAINNEDASLTFDFKTRRKLKLSDLFFRKPNTLKTIRKHLYKAVTDNACRDKLNFFIESETLFKDHLKFYLAKNGIALQLQLPVGLSSCIKDILIPYKVVSESMSYTSTLKGIKSIN